MSQNKENKQTLPTDAFQRFPDMAFTFSSENEADNFDPSLRAYREAAQPGSYANTSIETTAPDQSIVSSAPNSTAAASPKQPDFAVEPLVTDKDSVVELMSQDLSSAPNSTAAASPKRPDFAVEPLVNKEKTPDAAISSTKELTADSPGSDEVAVVPFKRPASAIEEPAVASSKRRQTDDGLPDQDICVRNNKDLISQELPVSSAHYKPSPYDEGRIYPGIVVVNGVPFKGYHEETVHLVGGGSAVGLHAKWKVVVGDHAPPTLVLSFFIYHLGRQNKFVDVVIKLYEDGASADEVLVDDDATKQSIFSMPKCNLSALLPGAKSKQFEPEEVPDTIPDCKVLQYSVPAGAVIVLESTQFWKLKEENPAIYFEIAGNVMAALSNITALDSRTPVEFYLAVPADKDRAKAWKQIISPPENTVPFQQHLANEKDLTRLDFDTINCNVTREGFPVPKTLAFVDERHRSVTLIGGAVDEAVLTDTRAGICMSNVIPMKAIPIEGSQWLPREDDNTQFGVVADGTHQTYLFVAQIDERTRDVLPDVGQYVKIYTTIPQGQRPLPQVVLDPDQLRKVAIAMQCDIVHAVHVARSQTEEEKRKAEQQDGSASDAEQFDEEEFDAETVYKNKYVSQAAKVLFSSINTQLAEECRTSPKDENEYLTGLAASKAANELHQGDDESDVKHLERITRWIRDRGNVENPMPEDDETLGEPFTGTRIEPERNLVTNLALFLVRKPVQANWVRGLEPPPLDIVVPTVTVTGDLETLLNSLFTDQGRPAQEEFSACIWFEEKVTSLKAEAAAVRDMNIGKESSTSKVFWKYTLQFGTFPEEYERDLLEVFPELKRRVEADGYYDRITRGAIARLKKTRAGFVFISGVPGSGKTHLAFNMSLGVLAGPTHADAGWKSSIAKPIEPSQRKVLPPMTAEMDAQIDEEIGIISPGTSSVPAKRTVGSGWQKQIADYEASTDQTKQRLNKSAVAWTAPQNSQVDDAVSRFAQRADVKSIIRAYPYEKEVASMFRTEPKPAVTYEPAAHHNDTVKRLSRHINRVNSSRATERSPLTDNNSLSSAAKRKVAANPQRWATVIEGQENVTNAEIWSQNKGQYKAAAREAMEETLQEAEVVCATPYCLGQIASHHSNWRPSLLVQDEASRMSEAMTAVAMSKYKGVPTIFSGDPKQFGPYVGTENASFDETYGDKEFIFSDLFGPQRGLSLHQRAVERGAADIELTRNHRAHGHSGDWARLHVYAGQMTVVNKAVIEPVQLLLNLFKMSVPKLLICGLFVDLQGTTEVQVGTSFINKSTGRFCVEYALYLLNCLNLPCLRDYLRKAKEAEMGRAKILIITPYVMQRNFMTSLLESISACELPPGFVTVRTIDDSPSHEAEIVIVDLPRTSKIGFMADSRRAAVMTTRANYATIYVGDGGVAKKGNHNITSIFEWHETKDAVIRVKGWDSFCDNCLQHGHLKRVCMMYTLKCALCGGQHAGRNCTQHRDVPGPSVAGSPVKLDNISRNHLGRQEKENKDKGKKVKLPKKSNLAPKSGATLMKESAAAALASASSRIPMRLKKQAEEEDSEAGGDWNVSTDHDVDMADTAATSGLVETTGADKVDDATTTADQSADTWTQHSACPELPMVDAVPDSVLGQETEWSKTTGQGQESSWSESQPPTDW